MRHGLGASIAIFLSAFVTLDAAGQDFFGPANPSSATACDAHFNPVFAETRRQVDEKVKRECDPHFGKNLDAHTRCYAQVSRLRESLHDQATSGRSACYARARDGAARMAQQQSRQASRQRTMPLEAPSRSAATSERDAERASPSSAVRTSPSRNASRDHKRAEGVGLLAGLLFSAVLKSSVERETGRGAQSESQREAQEILQKNNDRAMKAFDVARDLGKTHPVVRQIQNFAWDQLNNDLRLVGSQLAVLDRQVSDITSQIPSQESASQLPAFVPSQPIKVLDGATQVTYHGAVDSQERPAGMGRLLASIEDEGRVEYVGRFEAGRMSGPGRLSLSYPDGASAQWEGQFVDGEPHGPVRHTERSASGATWELKGDFGATTPFPIRYRSSDGVTYDGSAIWTAAHFEPTRGPLRRPEYLVSGHGMMRSAAGQTLTGKFINGELQGLSVLQEPSGQKRYCVVVNNRCNGPTEIRGPAGLLEVGLQADNVWQGEVYFSRSEYVFTGHVRDGRFNGLGKIIWKSGSYYEGEWAEGSRTGLGRYVEASGWTREGRFEDGKFVDGQIQAAGGQVTTVGSGQKYTVPSYAPSSQGLSGLADTIGSFFR